MQALSEEDRRLWMEAMDGREPVSDDSGQLSRNEGPECVTSLLQWFLLLP